MQTPEVEPLAGNGEVSKIDANDRGVLAPLIAPSQPFRTTPKTGR